MKRFLGVETYQKPIVNRKNGLKTVFFFFFGFSPKMCVEPTNPDGQKMQKIDFPKIAPKCPQISNFDGKWV